MKACSRTDLTTSSLWGLWRLVFKLLGISPGSLKIDKYVATPTIESKTAVATLPELPQDVLTVIFANLEIPELIRAGSVCATWHAAYTSLCNFGLYKQPQTPCLFYASESAGDNVGCLYSLVERREYKLTVPDPPIRSRFIIGSSNGWLITADDRSELHLLNPTTREQIALPSVITIEQVKPVLDDSGNIYRYELSYYTGEEVYREPEIHALNELREYCYYKAFVFPDPSTGSYFVVIIHNPYGQLSFARLGDRKWTWLPHNAGYKDCICVDGLLYALTSFGEIDAFDLAGPTVTRKVIMAKVKDNNSESMYLIPAPWGDILQVWRMLDCASQVYSDDDDNDDDASSGIVNAPSLEHDPASPLAYITKKILVFKVDMDAKVLVRIKSLPYHMLFLGHNHSLCLAAAEYPQLKANHFYFTDDHDELIMVAKNYTRDIGVINLENHRREEIASQIWSNWPCPTWIMPNLTKMNNK